MLLVPGNFLDLGGGRGERSDPLAMDSDVEVHDVKPREVSEYYRFDGTPVDGNTHIDLMQEHGGGYIRSNPDGNLNNNLG